MLLLARRFSQLSSGHDYRVGAVYVQDEGKQILPFLFPTSGCRPKLDFLDCLKVVAKRAGLNPDDCWLHKFRATFATRCLQAGVDLRTVQAWLGHADLESTMRYLRPARISTMKAKMDAIFA